jgi:hypothetical protein
VPAGTYHFQPGILMLGSLSNCGASALLPDSVFIGDRFVPMGECRGIRMGAAGLTSYALSSRPAFVRGATQSPLQQYKHYKRWQELQQKEVLVRFDRLRSPDPFNPLCKSVDRIAQNQTPHTQQSYNLTILRSLHPLIAIAPSRNRPSPRSTPSRRRDGGTPSGERRGSLYDLRALCSSLRPLR